jgi:hypothetical protein
MGHTRSENQRSGCRKSRHPHRRANALRFERRWRTGPPERSGQVGTRGAPLFLSCRPIGYTRPDPEDSLVSLWTPDGERPVRREPATPPSQSASPMAQGGPPPGGDSPSLEDLSPEERAQAEAMMTEMAEVQQRIAQTPAAEVIANHLMGFYELAAIHLSQEPPHFTEAAVAIDALRAVLETLGDRLGENVGVLNQALSQMQMAFVQLKQQTDEPPSA